MFCCDFFQKLFVEVEISLSLLL